MMTWQERRKLSLASYRPSVWAMAIDSEKLRLAIAGATHGRIPKDREGWLFDVSVPLRNGERIIANILVKASKSIGDKQCRGGRGHRLFIQCPACAKVAVSNPIPIGRLHQHYGYRHT